MHNIYRQNPHCIMNRNLNNEGQEFETGHAKGKVLVGRGG
jgi:hypothetical protein